MMIFNHILHYVLNTAACNNIRIIQQDGKAMDIYHFLSGILTCLFFQRRMKNMRRIQEGEFFYMRNDITCNGPSLCGSCIIILISIPFCGTKQLTFDYDRKT